MKTWRNCYLTHPKLAIGAFLWILKPLCKRCSTLIPLFATLPLLVRSIVFSSKQREEVPSLTPDEITRNFVSIVPQIIVEAVEKLSPFLGEVGGITAHYQKALVVFYTINNLIVIISFQPEVATPFFNRITDALQEDW